MFYTHIYVINITVTLLENILFYRIRNILMKINIISLITYLLLGPLFIQFRLNEPRECCCTRQCTEM